LFNPTDPASAKYNPLLEVRRGADEVRDAQNIADILVDPEGALERRSHWEKTSHSLLVGAILHVLYAEEEKTLARVATFLSDPQRPFVATLKRMMSTNHIGTKDMPLVHPVVASAAREVLNKSENERSGVLSTAMSFLGLYRDPTVAEVTSRCDWRIADLVEAEHPVSLYLVIPPSDISRTKPLVRLILNQIGRRLTEKLESDPARRGKHQLLMMLDEFPALGRLDFFETSLAFMAGYGVRAFLIAQSLNQIEKAYGEHNSILDNCHVRVAFATNDERTARRISDALGVATEQRAMRNYAGHGPTAPDRRSDRHDHLHRGPGPGPPGRDHRPCRRARSPRQLRGRRPHSRSHPSANRRMSMSASRLSDRQTIARIGIGFGLALAVAAAAQAAGSGMPWEEPLQQVLESVQGPVAKIIAVIIIIMTGLTLAFGETAGGFRRLIQIIFGLSIAFAASSFFLSFFSFGGGALIA